MNRRFDEIDYFRGLCIVMMVMVHADDFLPYPFKQIVQLVLDAVAEGFILISGFTIAVVFFPRMEKDYPGVSKKIIRRGCEILIIHYLMMLTIDLPKSLWLDSGDFHLARYLQEMILLRRLPFLLDILPIFFFLMMSAPVIGYLFLNAGKVTPAVISALLFAFSLFHPYYFSIQDRVTFPFIQWQLFFTLGIYTGYYREQLGQVMTRHRLVVFGLCTIVLCGLIYFRHAVSIHPEWVTEIKQALNLHVVKFPMSIWGLLYGLALLAGYYYVFDRIYRNSAGLSQWVRTYLTMIGRHSLFCFVLHVYLDYIFKNIDAAYRLPQVGGIGVLVVSLFLLYAASMQKERVARAMRPSRG